MSLTHPVGSASEMKAALPKVGFVDQLPKTGLRIVGIQLADMFPAVRTTRRPRLVFESSKLANRFGRWRQMRDQSLRQACGKIHADAKGLPMTYTPAD